MKYNTYETFKRANLGITDPDAFSKVLSNETDPFIHQMADFTQKTKRVSSVRQTWDVTPFTHQFRSVPARQRMDETVITFLLRLAAIVKDEMFFRSLTKPGSNHIVLVWTELFKECVFTILTLLYHVEWTSEHFLFMNRTVLDLLTEGRASELRKLMEGLGIRVSSSELYVAERTFESLSYLQSDQFGSFYWRLLHWMAEAVQKRPDHKSADLRTAKRTWRRMVTGPLYRTLLCSICKNHMQGMMKELKAQLLDESVDFARLWYDIHNRVNAKAIESRYFLPKGMKDTFFVYPEEEYARDAQFMHQAFSP